MSTIILEKLKTPNKLSSNRYDYSETEPDQ